MSYFCIVKIQKINTFDRSVCSLKLININTIHLNIVICGWVFNER
jgi:hypothetical protein